MTNIIIQRLSLENFKCHRNLTLEFHGGNASIYGNNATGKTSIYDALTWLLFGKDSAGNGEKNIDIKPLDESGAVRDHEAITSVEAVLEVNGAPMTLKRTFREVWSTKRGSSTATYDGNTSEYYVDGVPCKKNAFQDRVGALVNEDTFRLLTSVSYFASDLPWQERRAVLFDLAGTLSDREIMATDSRFSSISQTLGNLSLDDYRRKLAAEKKGFVGAKTDIPARISECLKTIEDIEGLDFAKAKADAETLGAKQSELASRILAIDHDSAADQKQLEIRAAQLDLDKLETENRAFRASQMVGTVDVPGMKRSLSALERQLERKKALLTAAEQSVAQYDKQIAASREHWNSVNSEAFTGGVCPTCGQALPAAQLQAAADRFDSQKKKRLQEIVQTANAQKESKARTEARIGELQAEVSELQSEAIDARAQISGAEAAAVEPKDMDGYQEKAQAIQNRIFTLSAELHDMRQNSSSVKESLRQELAEVNAQIKQNMDIISKESLLEYSRKRVEELRQDAQNAAECLEAIEKMLFLMDEYSRYKTRFVEESINSLFRLVKFRLFREQANGGVEDRCDVTYNGIPYASLNSGAKINVGIDIINTLSQCYGTSVPLFIDNAESVTKLESTGMQTIRLVVSEADKELRCEYEN